MIYEARRNGKLVALVRGNPREVRALGQKLAERFGQIRLNPSRLPVVGEVWRGIKGDRCRIISVTPNRVTVLQLDSGHRVTSEINDFLATYKPPATRPNPKRKGRKGASGRISRGSASVRVRHRSNPRRAATLPADARFLGWWTVNGRRWEVYRDQSDTKTERSWAYHLIGPRGAHVVLARASKAGALIAFRWTGRALTSAPSPFSRSLVQEDGWIGSGRLSVGTNTFSSTPDPYLESGGFSNPSLRRRAARRSAARTGRRANPKGRSRSELQRHTVAVRGYFRGDPKYGRVTRLVDGGTVLFTGMGVISKKALIDAYLHEQAKGFSQGGQKNPRSTNTVAGAKQMHRTWMDSPHYHARMTKVKVPPRPKALAKLGDLVEIVYRSNKYGGTRYNKKGKPLLYTHRTQRPHPVLAADGSGHVHIVGGKMVPTADGLVH